LYRDVSPLISRITFDTGDMFTGMLSNLTRGESLMEMMAGMKYDAMAIGNHEFDYGSDNFESRVPSSVPDRRMIQLLPYGPFRYGPFRVSGRSRPMIGLAVPEHPSSN
jgi:hypothetical protein